MRGDDHSEGNRQPQLKLCVDTARNYFIQLNEFLVGKLFTHPDAWQFSRWRICHLSCNNEDTFPHIPVFSASALNMQSAKSSDAREDRVSLPAGKCVPQGIPKRRDYTGAWHGARLPAS